MAGFQDKRNGGAHNAVPLGVVAGAVKKVPLPPAANKPSVPKRHAGLRQNVREVPDLPLELLTSEANQRNAQHLRLAYEALVEVERERGLYYGDTLSDMLADCLEQAECEVYGPKGLLGAE